ncbi:MAG: hypothetical protein DDT18_01798 [Actinobacteria bacterium]|nr:hypothetical protein [Actinomycetota bacterium]
MVGQGAHDRQGKVYLFPARGFPDSPFESAFVTGNTAEIRWLYFQEISSDPGVQFGLLDLDLTFKSCFLSPHSPGQKSGAILDHCGGEVRGGRLYHQIVSHWGQAGQNIAFLYQILSQVRTGSRFSPSLFYEHPTLTTGAISSTGGINMDTGGHRSPM